METYRKTGTRGKWIIKGGYTAYLSRADERRSRVLLRWQREEKTINLGGRIITILRDREDNFVINGKGKKAIENIVNLINQGCFS